jgi:hypothetical protein
LNKISFCLFFKTIMNDRIVPEQQILSQVYQTEYYANHEKCNHLYLFVRPHNLQLLAQEKWL